MDAHGARGLHVEAGLIHEGNWSEESGYEGLSRFMSLAERPSAVFCCNDLMAVGAIRAAADQGANVRGISPWWASTISTSPRTSIRG